MNNYKPDDQFEMAIAGFIVGLTLPSGITPLNVNIAYPAPTPITYGRIRVHGAMYISVPNECITSYAGVNLVKIAIVNKNAKNMPKSEQKIALAAFGYLNVRNNMLFFFALNMVLIKGVLT